MLGKAHSPSSTSISSETTLRTSHEEAKVCPEGSLLWDCFVNWAATLEKLEQKQATSSDKESVKLGIRDADEK